MQILDIVLYSKDGRKRSVNFRPNQVNIIVGLSGTGKSALNDIVEYCLGSSHCNIPEGTIRDKVSWFGIKLQMKTDQVFIARENPGYGKQSTNRAYIDIASSVKIPEECPKSPNITIDNVVKLLSNKLGIGANKTEPSKTSNRSSLSANIKHTFFYIIQEQDEIATKKYLFHRQYESWAPETIKNTLPYFLGVIPEDRLELISSLKDKERKLKRLEKELDTDLSINKTSLSQIPELISEANELGLMMVDVQTSNPLDSLKNAINWQPEKINDRTTENDQLTVLSDQLIEIREKIKDISYAINQANILLHESSKYSSESTKQTLRLRSIGLYPQTNFDSDSCPICSSKLFNPSPKAELIWKSISKLEQQLESVEREKPKILHYIEEKKLERQLLRQKAEELSKAIQGIYNENDVAKHNRDLNFRRGRIIGKISLFLESIDSSDDNSELQRSISELNREKKELEELLDPITLEDDLQSAINIISTDITNYARTLHLEHSSYPIRFNYNRLTITSDRDDKPISLQQMGSSTNYMGYHLATLFALHKYFRKRDRPVPQFLILDQISQVAHASVQPDKEATKNAFEFIFAYSKEMSSCFQIILTEHAVIEEKWFEEAVIDWFDKEHALIPNDW